MFCDLEKVDIIYTRADGAQIGVQTDHRSTAEMQEDLPRTLVFTLARIIRPLAAGLGLSAIEVVFAHMPPEAVREAVEVAGARVRAEDALLEPRHEPDAGRADEIAAAALATIGRAALTAAGLEISAAGLEALEALRAEEVPEYATWPAELRYTAVLELGAAAGEVLRAEYGGAWVRDHTFAYDVPFTVERENMRSNLFGRATRFFEESSEEGPSRLLRSATESATDGEILPLIRRAGYGSSTEVVLPSRPLLAGANDVEDMPHVYLVQDRPESVSYINDLAPDDFEVLLDASLENLRRRAVRPVRVSEDVPIFLLEGDLFAVAKLLDKGLLAGLAEALEIEMLMVAAPTLHAAFVAPLNGEIGFTQAFLSLVASTYEDASPSLRLSPLVFSAAPAHGVQGILRLEEVRESEEPPLELDDAPREPDEAEAEPVKPWWKKLFGL